MKKFKNITITSTQRMCSSIYMGKPENMTSGCTIIFKSNWIAKTKFFNCDMNPKTQRLQKLMPHLHIILQTGIHIADIC